MCGAFVSAASPGRYSKASTRGKHCHGKPALEITIFPTPFLENEAAAIVRVFTKKVENKHAHTDREGGQVRVQRGKGTQQEGGGRGRVKQESVRIRCVGLVCSMTLRGAGPWAHTTLIYTAPNRPTPLHNRGDSYVAIRKRGCWHAHSQAYF